MTRAWLAIAAISGFLSVVAGTVAAHLASRGPIAELLRTGALYGMVHAATLVAVTAIAEARAWPGLALIVAGWSFTVGMTLFSLSLFALALTSIRWLGLITPCGGAGLLVGWAALGLHASHRR
jgi:uncharacterized membrane protein YgdD (TMEM256/DUF423 family)